MLFITKHGHRWDKPGRFAGDVAPAQSDEADTAPRPRTISSNNALSKEFRKLANESNVSGTFYDLRHTFRTIAGGSKDLEAIRFIMGHAHEHIEDTYIEHVEDERLRDVANYVRNWLYSK